jgi:2-polyprenyl-3-methyl-5-hydroxy-6-metoxy-1,4-benzoquinol methylase
MNIEYTERQRIEKLYHDRKFSGPVADTTTIPGAASKYFWATIGQPRGKTILDFGCGDGWLSVRLAKLDNRVHAFDISGVLISQARQFALSANVAERIDFAEMPAENLHYPPDIFDLVIGTSILHHTDLEVTLTRLRNVLKKSGTAVFLEPLNQNPALQIWRLMTPGRRSETERALTSADLRLIQRLFPETRATYFCFTSMFAEGLRVFAPRSRALAALSRALDALDRRLLAAMPWLGRFSAVVVLEMRK